MSDPGLPLRFRGSPAIGRSVYDVLLGHELIGTVWKMPRNRWWAATDKESAQGFATRADAGEWVRAGITVVRRSQEQIVSDMEMDRQAARDGYNPNW